MDFLKIIVTYLQAALIIYDVGIMSSDDKALAAATWRRFFAIQEQPDGPQIELLVKYIRQTMAMLDEIPTQDLYGGRLIKWLSLDSVNSC